SLDAAHGRVGATSCGVGRSVSLKPSFSKESSSTYGGWGGRRNESRFAAFRLAREIALASWQRSRPQAGVSDYARPLLQRTPSRHSDTMAGCVRIESYGGEKLYSFRWPSTRRATAHGVLGLCRVPC